MPYVRRVSRLRKRSKRCRSWCVVLAGAVVAALLAGWNWSRGRLPVRQSIDNPSEAKQAAGPADRIIYRHSVIAGGAYNRTELVAALAADRVAARHYADFRLDRVRTLRISSERSVFVSYRVGGSIYWTRKPIHLVAGETLLTDGVEMARARCGNRISETPQEPVAKEEVAAAELDWPEPGNTPAVDAPGWAEAGQPGGQATLVPDLFGTGLPLRAVLLPQFSSGAPTGDGNAAPLPYGSTAGGPFGIGGAREQEAPPAVAPPGSAELPTDAGGVRVPDSLAPYVFTTTAPVFVAAARPSQPSAQTVLKPTVGTMTPPLPCCSWTDFPRDPTPPGNDPSTPPDAPDPVDPSPPGGFIPPEHPVPPYTPEPASYLLIGTGILVLVAGRKRIGKTRL